MYWKTFYICKKTSEQGSTPYINSCEFSHRQDVKIAYYIKLAPEILSFNKNPRLLVLLQNKNVKEYSPRVHVLLTMQNQSNKRFLKSCCLTFILTIINLNVQIRLFSFWDFRSLRLTTERDGFTQEAVSAKKCL